MNHNISNSNCPFYSQSQMRALSAIEPWVKPWVKVINDVTDYCSIGDDREDDGLKLGNLTMIEASSQPLLHSFITLLISLSSRPLPPPQFLSKQIVSAVDPQGSVWLLFSRYLFNSYSNISKSLTTLFSFH